MQSEKRDMGIERPRLDISESRNAHTVMLSGPFS